MQNFGKITNSYNGILVEGLPTKDKNSRIMFKKYVKTIKENEILKTQFLIYDNIENKVEPNGFKANLYLQENLALLNKFDREEIKKLNLALAKPITESYNKVYDNIKLHEDIEVLIFTNKSPKNIDIIVEATGNIVDFITNNKPREIYEDTGLPNSMMTSILVDKYNERYSSISESEKNLLRVLIDLDSTKKEEVYLTTLRECIDMVNERLVGSSAETKDKLLNVKDKLLNDKKEINEDFVNNISKLIALKDSLT
jgi:hypothetical protein